MADELTVRERLQLEVEEIAEVLAKQQGKSLFEVWEEALSLYRLRLRKKIVALYKPRYSSIDSSVYYRWPKGVAGSRCPHLPSSCEYRVSSRCNQPAPTPEEERMHSPAADPLTWTSERELLVIQAAQDDPTCFGPLYEHYRDPVYRYLRSRTATAEEAEDLLQQVFLRALDALPRYHPDRSPFVAWLLGIARHVSLDAHRRHHERVPWDFVPEVLRAGDSEVEAEVLRREDQARLGRLFAALPSDKRELLVLRFVARLSVREIAAVLGKSEAATKKQLFRTLQTLKEQYHDNA
jgi:RNA polymerase sigma-70 factor (ECF subfamily)